MKGINVNICFGIHKFLFPLSGIVGQNVQSHHWLHWDTDPVNLKKMVFGVMPSIIGDEIEPIYHSNQRAANFSKRQKYDSATLLRLINVAQH